MMCRLPFRILFPSGPYSFSMGVRRGVIHQHMNTSAAHRIHIINFVSNVLVQLLCCRWSGLSHAKDVLYVWFGLVPCNGASETLVRALFDGNLESLSRGMAASGSGLSNETAPVSRHYFKEGYNATQSENSEATYNENNSSTKNNNTT